MTDLVVGGGAVGTLIAWALATGGRDVAIVRRAKTDGPSQAEVALVDPAGSRRAARVTEVAQPDDLPAAPELIAFAKKMKARQFARMLEFEDEESGLRIKRLWSFYDRRRARRYYADILEMPEDQRKRLIRQYARFVKQLRAVRKAMGLPQSGHAGAFCFLSG